MRQQILAVWLCLVSEGHLSTCKLTLDLCLRAASISSVVVYLVPEGHLSVVPAGAAGGQQHLEVPQEQHLAGFVVLTVGLLRNTAGDKPMKKLKRSLTRGLFLNVLLSLYLTRLVRDELMI